MSHNVQVKDHGVWEGPHTKRNRCHGYRLRRTEQLENSAHPSIIMANDGSILIKEMIS